MNQNNQIIKFQFSGRAVRVIDVGNEPWFIAADVCAILDISNPTQALTRLDDDETTLISNEGRPTNVINESGLYSLVLGSRKPEARAFKKWVTSEVLPSIRQHGGYLAGQENETDPAVIMARALKVADNVIANQQRALQAARSELAAALPAVKFLDNYVEARSTKSLREAAKVLGMREREFIDRLRSERILFKQSGSWYPHAQYHHRGLFEVKTGEANGHAYCQTRFTPAGIAWIAKRFGLLGAA